MPPQKLQIAFIGFGELGQRFARDLSKHDRVRLSAFDILFADAKRGPKLREAAKTLNVTAAETAGDACTGADVVISAVTADQTERVARAAQSFLTVGQVFLDVNSASPETKKKAAQGFQGTGVHYVEGAVMGAVSGPGIRVQILAGGPRAEDVALTLNAVGMALQPVAKIYGRASAIKLCRSIVIKGMEALLVDCAAATKHWGVAREVYDSLMVTFPSIDWPALADDMNERVATHGIRRAAEMREAAAMLKDIGLRPDLAAAVAEAHQRGAKPKAD